MKSEISANKSLLFINKFKSTFIVFASGQLLLVFAAFLDSMIAGNGLNIEALKAVQIITPIIAFISFTGSLIASGVGARYFYLQNKEENEKAKSLIFSSILLSILIGIISALILYFIKEPFINLFPVSQECVNYAKEYYFWFIIIAAILPLVLLETELVYRDYGNTFKSQCGY